MHNSKASFPIFVSVYQFPTPAGVRTEDAVRLADQDAVIFKLREHVAKLEQDRTNLLDQLLEVSDFVKHKDIFPERLYKTHGYISCRIIKHKHLFPGRSNPALPKLQWSIQMESV